MACWEKTLLQFVRLQDTINLYHAGCCCLSADKELRAPGVSKLDFPLFYKGISTSATWYVAHWTLDTTHPFL